MITSSVDGTATVISSLRQWATQPFDMQMDLTHWALFTGLIIVLAVMWIMVLRELKGDILS